MNTDGRMNFYTLCYPILAGAYDKNTLKKVRFLGTCVFLDITNKKIITCSHLHDYIMEGEILCISFRNTDKFYPLCNIKRHSTIDLMTAEIETNDPIDSRINLIDILQDFNELSLGQELRAFGYFSESPNAAVPTVLNQIRQGYITFSSSNNEGTKKLGGNSRRELSFSCPNGMSGSPVLDLNYKPMGILFNNIESSIAKWEHTEIQEDGSTYREIRLRIEEHAIFHTFVIHHR